MPPHRPRKRFGQHFLHDPNMIARIVRAIHPRPGDRLVEMELLYLAAMQAKRTPAWQGYYQRCIARGLAPVQALNVLARKLARVAFSLMRNQSEYIPRIH